MRIKPKKRRKRNASEGVLTPTAVTVEMHRKKDEKSLIFYKKRLAYLTEVLYTKKACERR